MFKLVIQDDEGKTTVVPLIRDEITIGRKEGNTIRLTERNVSRRHARILRNNGEVHIEDLGSYNGIRVNNARIAERVSLRVSDQVQIGDYKLYLKAEGVEQVDDARTMPIERVDATATDVIPAVASVAPTAPIAVPPIPSTPAPGQLNKNAQLIGNPNHTLVAVADTDPSGRPLASAAVVAALAAPVGFGKLVVLSSNFAGKEFDLSRPQMIVGRTDENDLVINHRSISRNHAKLVREPDTGRYTISDLQSSNGVRVNGQDYGKVELRRGDVIDLGHVRLRFVEPGEDFVFSRDAVITDVPDVGGKKGLLVAIVLGVVVLAGIAIFAMTRGGGEKDTNVANPGSQSTNDIDSGPGPAVAVLQDGGNDFIKDPIDAGPGANPAADVKQQNVKCLDAQTNRKWPELEECGAEMAKLDAAQGKMWKDKGVAEARAEADLRNLKEAAAKGTQDLKKAQGLLTGIGEASVYRKEAVDAVAKLKKAIVDELVADLRRLKTDCKGYNTRVAQARTSHGDDVADEGKSRTKCEGPPAVARCTDATCGAGSKCGDDGKCVRVVVVPKTCPDVPCAAGMKCDDGKCKTVKQECDPAAVTEAESRGDSNNGQGNYAAAMAAYESQLRCKGALGVKAYMAACKAKKPGEAKRYFKGYIPKERQEYFSQICLKEGIDPRL